MQRRTQRGRSNIDVTATHQQMRPVAAGSCCCYFVKLLRANNKRRASGDGLVGWWPWLGLWAPLVGILDGWRAQPLRFETGGFRQTTRTTVQPIIVRNTGVDWSRYVGCRLPGGLNLAAKLSPMGFVMNLLSVEEPCTVKYGA